MAVVKLVACGRDQTPFGAAIGYLCTRPRGHSGPCAMVYFEGPGQAPEHPLDPIVNRFATAMCVAVLVIVIVFAFALAVLSDGLGVLRGHP